MGTTVIMEKAITCYHCGEPCNEDAKRVGEKYFCCDGCQLVFEILQENNLDTYYCLESTPGISFKKKKNSNRFDYLDDSAVIERLVDFRNNGYIAVSFYIPNIHCTSCVWLLENLFKLDSGIINSSVNFLKRELSISLDEQKTTLRSVAELLTSIGYEPELKLEKLDKEKATSPDRRLWLKLGMAGFSFGNIMLFSVPEYLSGFTLSSQGSFHILFGLLNIALSLPVLFFSASDYLKSGWAAVRQGGINLDVPISIGILALFIQSVYEIFTGIGPGYLDSFTGLVFFLLIGRIIQKKTYERLSFDRDYKSYLPISVTTIREDGSERTVSVDKLEKGVRILIRNGELVPADAVMLSETGFVDYSFITGEADPVEMKQGDTVYAGGKLVGPTAELSVVKEVSNSYLTKLWNNAAFDDSSQHLKVSTLADRISPYFTLVVIGIAVVAALMWWPESVEMSLSVFTAVLIIACPCALALSTPFTLGSALNVFSKNGMFIKGTEAIEQLSGITSVVFDKTGTLTEPKRAEILLREGVLSDHELRLVKSACRQSVHPLSQKIADSLDNYGALPVETFEEVVNKGIKATVDGSQIRIGSASFVAESVAGESDVSTGKMANRSGASEVHIVINGEWKGWFKIAGSYRSGVKELLTGFKNRVETYLVSGDNASERSSLSPYFPRDALRFNQTPQQKLEFIKKLQDKGERVVMIGDGLNDAGALQQSDFGIALTDSTSSFTPACDAIMDGAALNRFDTFVDFSQKSMTTIKLSFGLSLMYNIEEGVRPL